MCCMIIRFSTNGQTGKKQCLICQKYALHSSRPKMLTVLPGDWNEKSKELKVKFQGVSAYVQIKILHL